MVRGAILCVAAPLRKLRHARCERLTDFVAFHARLLRLGRGSWWFSIFPNRPACARGRPAESWPLAALHWHARHGMLGVGAWCSVYQRGGCVVQVGQYFGVSDRVVGAPRATLPIINTIFPTPNEGGHSSIPAIRGDHDHGFRGYRAPGLIRCYPSLVAQLPGSCGGYRSDDQRVSLPHCVRGLLSLGPLGPVVHWVQ